jgi:hypothetical protein
MPRYGTVHRSAWTSDIEYHGVVDVEGLPLDLRRGGPGSGKG